MPRRGARTGRVPNAEPTKLRAPDTPAPLFIWNFIWNLGGGNRLAQAMEGFVRPTKAQKLAAVAATLERVYAKDTSAAERLFGAQLRQLAAAERAERPGGLK